MSMPGNGTEVAEHQKQLSSQQQRLLDPLRPASGQVTPVFGKAHIDSLRFEYLYVQITRLYFCDVSCRVFVVAVVCLTVMLWALHRVLIHYCSLFWSHHAFCGNEVTMASWGTTTVWRHATRFPHVPLVDSLKKGVFWGGGILYPHGLSLSLIHSSFFLCLANLPQPPPLPMWLHFLPLDHFTPTWTSSLTEMMEAVHSLEMLELTITVWCRGSTFPRNAGTCHHCVI